MEKLAEALAAKVSNATGPSSRRAFRLVEKARPTLFDSITRESVLRRIRFLRKAYCLQWLVDQACFDQPSVECLADEQLAQLLRDLETARECIAEGVPFEDADLVRSTASQLPELDF